LRRKTARWQTRECVVVDLSLGGSAGGRRCGAVPDALANGGNKGLGIGGGVLHGEMI
jgi:hypothetical protein